MLVTKGLDYMRGDREADSRTILRLLRIRESLSQQGSIKETEKPRWRVAWCPVSVEIKGLFVPGFYTLTVVLPSSEGVRGEAAGSR